MSDPFDINAEINAERAQGATEWMVHNAEGLARAKAHSQMCERMLKSTKALCMKCSNGKTVAEREADAYSSPEYLKAVQNEFEATFEYEKLKALFSAAQSVADLWRSLNSAQKASRV